MKPIRMMILAAAMVLGLAALGCGDDDDNPVIPPGTADVTITIPSGASGLGDQAYFPDTASVQVGQTVRWVNNDVTAHTATADGGTFNTGTIGAGASSALITITGAAGIRTYHCGLHPSMTGALNVTP